MEPHSSSLRPPLRDKGRLPSYFSSAIEEKHHLTSRPSRWLTTFYIPLPNRQRIKIPLPIPPAIWNFVSARTGRKRASAFVWAVIIGLMWLAFILIRAIRTHNHPPWTKPIIGEPPSLVFGREDLRRIWNWEIASGHYPSSAKIPDQIRLTYQPQNPGIPPPHDTRGAIPSVGSTIGTGSDRTYLDIHARPPSTAYPPRVPPGSVADLDVIMDNCDFSQQKTVRDCLEVLRIGAGLDVNRRLRRGNVDMWRYIYLEDSASKRAPAPKPPHQLSNKQLQHVKGVDPDEGLWRRDELEPPLTNLPTPIPAKPFADLKEPCDPDYPRVFHMFWAGPFTEKPYVALLSFLFTQNVGLHLEKPDPKVCRPQFWVWINPGPAAAVPNPHAMSDMFNSLKASPWASPFLHPRFKDVIKFKMWNTTEQLDGVPELKDEWRKFEGSLFNSGGVKYQAPKAGKPAKKPQDTPFLSSSPKEGLVNSTAPDASIDSSMAKNEFIDQQKEKDDFFNRLGSTSSSTYDRLSVVLSDMARFILTHRFGGTYLDADTIFLRDWEDLWGWKGAFAYRWSRLEKYNTAVLRLNKGSALGSFLFKTALRNGLDFHPMTVSRYTKDAYLEGLLLRLPDALFDPAWLAQEGYQNDRPPFPMFKDFYHFFDPPSQEGAPPQALGFEGFFKGAYSYHFHNFWWVPFDGSRNFPDLGPRFIEGERKARDLLRAEAARKAKQAEAAAAASEKKKGRKGEDAGHAIPKTEAGSAPRYDPTKPLTREEEQRLMEEEDDVLTHDKRDLSWSAVMKRTFEAYIRGERPNMYGEWLVW